MYFFNKGETVEISYVEKKEKALAAVLANKTGSQQTIESAIAQFAANMIKYFAPGDSHHRIKRLKAAGFDGHAPTFYYDTFSAEIIKIFNCKSLNDLGAVTNNLSLPVMVQGESLVIKPDYLQNYKKDDGDPYPEIREKVEEYLGKLIHAISLYMTVLQLAKLVDNHIYESPSYQAFGGELANNLLERSRVNQSQEQLPLLYTNIKTSQDTVAKQFKTTQEGLEGYLLDTESAGAASIKTIASLKCLLEKAYDAYPKSNALVHDSDWRKCLKSLIGQFFTSYAFSEGYNKLTITISDQESNKVQAVLSATASAIQESRVVPLVRKAYLSEINKRLAEAEGNCECMQEELGYPPLAIVHYGMYGAYRQAGNIFTKKDDEEIQPPVEGVNYSG